jgi:hypothetical protein
MLATMLHAEDLVKTVVASLVAGVGLTLVFSIAIWGGVRFVDLNREGRSLAAGAAVALGGLALIASLGAVAVGIVVMTSN